MQLQENNYAFIDSQNLNLGIQSLGWKLDFVKFRRYLKEKVIFMDNLKGKLEYTGRPAATIEKAPQQDGT